MVAIVPDMFHAPMSAPTISKMKMMQIPRELAEKHYGEHSDKPFFGELVEFITSGPVVAMQVTGPDSVKVMRSMMGVTDPVEAAPGTVRGDLGLIITENLVHGSDAPATAERELALFFG